MSLRKIEKTLSPSDATLNADVLKLMNLGLFPKLCVALGIPSACEDLDSPSTSRWEIFSPSIGERKFEFTEDDDGNQELRFVEKTQERTSDFVIQSDEQLPVIQITKNKHLIQWEDGPYQCSSGETLLVSGTGFGSLYEYATGRNHNSCSETVAEFAANPWSLVRTIERLYEPAAT